MFRTMQNVILQPYTDEMVEQVLVPVDSLDDKFSACFNNAVKDNSVKVYVKGCVMKVYKDCLR